MAEAIGIASGLVSLATFALTSSQLLYQTISSIQNNNKAMRDLKDELESLESVLQTLNDTAENNEREFLSLECPLRRCGNACREFKDVVDMCTAHSKSDKLSFRDWLKIRYMGNDINGFKDLLAGYKSTIAIALGGVNIRTTLITNTALEEYKVLIMDTTVDLQTHLEDINHKLETLPFEGPRISTGGAGERQRMLDERESTQRCLEVCAQVSLNINNIFSEISSSTASVTGDDKDVLMRYKDASSAHTITSSAITDCTARFSRAKRLLEVHLHNVQDEIEHCSPQGYDSQSGENTRIREEMESIKQCLEICAQASQQASDPSRTNIIEDVSMADDGRQVIVSTVGDLISARRVKAGARSMQVMGQMSDESLQHIFRYQNHPKAMDS